MRPKEANILWILVDRDVPVSRGEYWGFICSIASSFNPLNQDRFQARKAILDLFIEINVGI